MPELCDSVYYQITSQVRGNRIGLSDKRFGHGYGAAIDLEIKIDLPVTGEAPGLGSLIRKVWALLDYANPVKEQAAPDS